MFYKGLCALWLQKQPKKVFTGLSYDNKAITKHKRGNYMARVWQNGKQVCIYGKTEQECYDKLKIKVDEINQEKAERENY